MTEIYNLIKSLKSIPIAEYKNIEIYIMKLQVFKSFYLEGKDLIFYGLDQCFKKVLDIQIYDLNFDAKLLQISKKIKDLEESYGLDEAEFFKSGDADTPEEFQALDMEYEYRKDELFFEIMIHYQEEEMANLYMTRRKSYMSKLYKGWKLFESDSPLNIKRIDGIEKLEFNNVNYLVNN